MNIRQCIIVTMTLLFSMLSIVNARVVNTQLPFMAGPRPLEFFHYWRNDYSEEYLFDLNVWGAGFARSAENALGSCGNTTKVPLAALIFGKSSFTVADAFAGSSVGSALPNNPFVSISTLSPRFDYSERSALFGMSLSFQFGCDNDWQAGLRVRFPFRDINVDLTCDSDLIGETLDDVFQTRVETIDFNPADLSLEQSNIVYAARLDFLSTLKQIAVNITGGSDDLVKYINNNPAQVSPVGQISIAGLEVGQDTPGSTDEPIVAVLRSNTGAVPSGTRWGNFNTTITGGTVGADGSGVPDGGRGRFVDTPNFYGPLSTNGAEQRTLFVVPTIDSTTNLIVGGANQILGAIRSSIGELSSSVTEFLKANNVDFCDGRTKGIGDVDTEWYVGKLFCDNRLWTEFDFGIRFPSGNKITDCGKVLQQPTGNNGHFEIRIGGALGYKINDWIRFNFDSFYSFVLRRKEVIAAPFLGATVKNLIGPCLCADVSWGYYLGHLDLTFFASDCCGVSIGYEPYVKSRDKVWKNFDKLTTKLCNQLALNDAASAIISSLVTKTTTDILGNTEQIDVAVIENNTNSVAHKMKLEFFVNSGACDIFGGWANVIAGHNVAQDTDWYLGFNVHF